MPSLKPLPIGTRFGQLVVSGERFKRPNDRHHFYVECVCDCGVKKSFCVANLKSGVTLSCGCYLKKLCGDIHRIHGMTETSEYKSWCGMKERCSRKTLKSYYRYGGRGITVCNQWINSFENFFRDMGPKPSPKHSLERRDNDGNYEPSNCYWATKKEQARNTRRNVFVEHMGHTKLLVEWAEILGVPYDLIQARLSKGKPFSEAIRNIPSHYSIL